ncbi:hypothetical protein BGX21_009126 [Mortierella sp. AD011]|nr:hypothetical protein BGX20_009568 [Mortierella sp. AD010]KAF9402682.1 hypothetical protein BGX21_009126 [Mortierella sp. AD011]
MERSFPQLLRTSRLATFDKTIPQIYTTTGKSKAIGDWGLKRNLPTVLRTHLLNVEELDTAEHQTPFKSASGDYLFLQRWKENFPTSRPPQPQPVTVKKDLSTMTDAEFKKLLQTARERRQAWKEALAKNEVPSDEHLSFMNIMNYSKAGSIDTSTSQASVGFGTSAVTTATSVPMAGSSTRVKVGPTYGFYEPSTPTIVQGRCLGRTRTNQLIGVCGAIATLPNNSSAHLQVSSKSLQQYYVHKAELDADGRPNIILGNTAPGPDWLTSRNDQYYSGGRLSANSTSSSSAAKEPEEGDTKHKVVSRVQNLLVARDKAFTRS